MCNQHQRQSHVIYGVCQLSNVIIHKLVVHQYFYDLALELLKQ